MMQINDIIALCVGGAVLVIVAVYLIVNQRTKVMEWLKYAVVEAEKQEYQNKEKDKNGQG